MQEELPAADFVPVHAVHAAPPGLALPAAQVMQDDFEVSGSEPGGQEVHAVEPVPENFPAPQLGQLLSPAVPA